jgi:hypothetical protein
MRVNDRARMEGFEENLCAPHFEHLVPRAREIDPLNRRSIAFVQMGHSDFAHAEKDGTGSGS